MTRQTDTVTSEAAAALAATSTEDLLTNAYALTHRIHEAAATARFHEGAKWAADTEKDLRAQRDLITAEVLRRTGGE